MTNNADYADFTNVYSRAMAQLTQSPVTSVVSGQNTQTFDVPSWCRSLNILVTKPTNVIALTVVGVQSGFTYLNASPIYDGGIYYIPAMPVIDTQIAVTWYQIAVTSTAIYIVGSDEPLSVSVFNPIASTLATSEHLTYTSPLIVAANTQAFINITPDITTKALRCTVDNPANVLWGKVVGNTTGTVYFDGTISSTSFPTTPVPIDAIADATVQVTIKTVVGGGASLYVAAVNVPDMSGSLPIANNMSHNAVVPDGKLSETPNQLPAIYDGTIPASGSVVMTGAVTGVQYRVHGILVMQYTAVATAFTLQDTLGNKFYHYHYSAAANSIYSPLFGQLCNKAAGISLVNTTAVLSGSVAVTLWYSVL